VSRGRLRGLLGDAAGRWPLAGIAAADALAYVTQPARLGLDEASIRRALPFLPPAELARTRRAAWSSWLRLRVVEAAVGSAGASWPYPPLHVDVSALRPPMILATFHLGPVPALGGLLEQLPGEVLVLQRSGQPRPSLTLLGIEADSSQRAAVFRRAVEALRGGGFVFVVVDAYKTAATVEATFLGRQVRLARGGFALARITGAPIVPLAARWRGRRIDIVAGDPILAGDESAMAGAVTSWLEDYVRENPGEIGRKFVERFGGES
jgi:hypothetical protein